MGVSNESTFDTPSAEGGSKESLKAQNPAPDGGLQAWLVVLGGFLTYFATFGIVLHMIAELTDNPLNHFGQDCSTLSGLSRSTMEKKFSEAPLQVPSHGSAHYR